MYPSKVNSRIPKATLVLQDKKRMSVGSASGTKLAAPLRSSDQKLLFPTSTQHSSSSIPVSVFEPVSKKPFLRKGTGKPTLMTTKSPAHKESFKVNSYKELTSYESALKTKLIYLPSSTKPSFKKWI